jgi:hypothetical protein
MRSSKRSLRERTERYRRKFKAGRTRKKKQDISARGIRRRE